MYSVHEIVDDTISYQLHMFKLRLIDIRKQSSVEVTNEEFSYLLEKSYETFIDVFKKMDKDKSIKQKRIQFEAYERLAYFDKCYFF